MNVFIGLYSYVSDSDKRVKYSEQATCAAMRDLFDDGQLSLLPKYTTRLSGLGLFATDQTDPNLAKAKELRRFAIRSGAIVEWKNFPQYDKEGGPAHTQLCEVCEKAAVMLARKCWEDYNANALTKDDLMYQLFHLAANGVDVLIVRDITKIPLDQLDDQIVYTEAELRGVTYTKYGSKNPTVWDPTGTTPAPAKRKRTRKSK